MKEFSHLICDEVGIHARPAGLLIQKASQFESEITLHKGEKTADAKKIFSVMSLAAKKGDEIIVRISGSDEDSAAAALEQFFKDCL